MVPCTLDQLAQIVDGQIDFGSSYSAAAKVLVTGAATDSRAVRRGDCFVAIRGATMDGHRFVPQALRAGAACAIVSRDFDGPAGPVVRVGDTVQALGALAADRRRQLTGTVIGITGSAGKTTTREIVAHVLGSLHPCHQARKSFNNHIGLPLTLLGAGPEHRYIVAELGSNAPGEIGALTAIARPDIAVVLNVFPAHLEGFGSVDNIVREKSSICQGLTPDGVFLINGDFPDLVEHCRRLGRDFKTFGFTPGLDVTAQNPLSDGAVGRLVIEGTAVGVPLPGRAALANTLAAWAVCRQVGVSVQQFARAIRDLRPVTMRMQVQRIGPVTVLNDCYNANPASMANALDTLKELAAHRGGRPVFICGTMAELGPASAALHEDLGQTAAVSGVQQLLAVGPWSDKVVAGARGVHPGLAARIFSRTGDLCVCLKDFIRPDDIVLIKGSRSMRLETVVEALEQVFEPVPDNPAMDPAQRGGR